MPVASVMEGFTYNKDAFDKLGLRPPSRSVQQHPEIDVRLGVPSFGCGPQRGLRLVIAAAPLEPQAEVMEGAGLAARSGFSERCL